MNDDITTEQIATITTFVDIDAPPPDDHPTALALFGSNRTRPAEIAAERYHRGLTPLIICMGGINRHNGINEARTWHRLLLDRGVPDGAIRCEDRSANTWQNVEYAEPFLREALNAGLVVTAVCKWYHRRAVHILKTLVPTVGAFHVITWEPTLSGRSITRAGWPLIPEGRRRVLREWEEVSRRVAEGGLADVRLFQGAWH
ncbi:YdcF family protein [Nonomuraea gerenzanensis]|uniref:DUF218 domain-containing protein n=1 Tax=Nonomuraea gerenzanensis TaxID=93944 RepID=A0A1M4DVY6_9ACTN|nr:YdcF family protein [Nonomuraea gerenzanensis]UBU13076.1 YdcF family protein [Nonomuraea gerenzanensis]SBO90718.1 hypothetical protein BN4615_P232 [Nonomuraea gerenzanensis]